MSDLDDLMGDDDGGQNDDDATRTPDDWAKYRRAENARKKAERERDDTKKELAFVKAGIDPEDERMRYFVKGYEGEHTPEKIREAATAAGFLAPPPAPAPDPQAAAAAAGLGRVDALADGAMPPDGGNPISALDDAFAKGGDKAVEDQIRQMGIPVRYSS